MSVCRTVCLSEELLLHGWTISTKFYMHTRRLLGSAISGWFYVASCLLGTKINIERKRVPAKQRKAQKGNVRMKGM